MVFEATLKEDKTEVPIKEAKPKIIKITVKARSQPKMKVKTTKLMKLLWLANFKAETLLFKEEAFLKGEEQIQPKSRLRASFLFDVEDENQLVRESAFNTDYEKEQKNWKSNIGF